MTNYKGNYLNKDYEGVLALYNKHLQPGLVQGEAAYHAIIEELKTNGHGQRARNSDKAG